MQQSAVIALYVGLRHLRREVSEAALCLASLSLPSSSTLHQQLQEAVHGLSRAARIAESQIVKHAASGSSLDDNDSRNTLTASQQQQEQDNQQCHEVQQQEHACSSDLYRTLDQLQQAAQAGMRSSTAALRSAQQACSQQQQAVAELLEAYDLMLKMADSIMQAQELLRQYAAYSNTATPAIDAQNGPDAGAAVQASTGTEGASLWQQQQPQQQAPGAAAGPPARQDAAAAGLGVCSPRPAVAVPAVLADESRVVSLETHVPEAAANAATLVQLSPEVFTTLAATVRESLPPPAPPLQQQQQIQQHYCHQGATGNAQDLSAAAALPAAATIPRRTLGRRRNVQKDPTTTASSDVNAEGEEQLVVFPSGGHSPLPGKRLAEQSASGALEEQQDAAQRQSSTPCKRKRVMAPPPKAATVAASASHQGMQSYQTNTCVDQASRQTRHRKCTTGPAAAAAAAAVAGCTRLDQATRQTRHRQCKQGPSAAAGQSNPPGSAYTATVTTARVAEPSTTRQPAEAVQESRAEARPLAAAANDDAPAAANLPDVISRLVQRMFDPKTTKQAARDLAKKATQSTAYKSAVRSSPEAIKGIMLLLDAANKPEDCCQAAVALRRLMTNSWDGQTAVAAAGGLQQLVQVVGSHRGTSTAAVVRAEAAAALHQLVRQHADNARAAAGDTACIATLCYMLQHRTSTYDHESDEAQPYSSAVFAARIICQLAVYCSAAAAQRLILALVAVLNDEDADDEALEDALDAVYFLCIGRNAHAAQNQVQLAAAGGIQALVRLLQSATAGNSSTFRVRIAAAFALGVAMNKSAANCAAFAAAGGTQLLVNMLCSSSSADVQHAAAEALYCFVADCDDHRAAVTAATAAGGGVVVPRLVELLNSHSEEVKFWAASLLAALADGDDAAAAATQAASTDAAALQALISMLSCNQADASGYCPAAAAAELLLVLGKYADLPTATSKAIQPLLQLLITAGPQLSNSRSQKCSSLASCTGAILCILKQSAANQVDFIKSGGVPAVVKLLTNCQNAAIAFNSASILNVLTLDDDYDEDEAQNADTASNSISRDNADDEVSTLSGIQRREVVTASGAIQPLVSLLNFTGSSGHDLDVAHQAAGALWNLADDRPVNKEAVVKAGAIPLLVQLLGYKPEDAEAVAADSHLQDIMYAAAGALATLAEGQPKHQGLIAAAGGIGKLVALLKLSSSYIEEAACCHHPIAQEPAAGALAALAASNPEAVVAAGAIPLLVKLLHVNDVYRADVLHRQVTDALAAICKGQPKHQAAIAAEPGAVAGLVHLQQTSCSEDVRKTASAVLNILRSHPTAGRVIPDADI